MKRIILLCIILSFLAGCSSVAAEVGTGEPPPAEASAGESAPGGNPNPIPVLKDVTEAELGAVLWWCDELSNGGMWEIFGDQKSALFAALQDIQLLDKGSAEDMVPELKFDLHLKNAETLTILFIGDCINIDGTLYHYKNYSDTAYPDEVHFISISNPAYDFQSVYEDPADIDALMTVLQTSPCPVQKKPDSLILNQFTFFLGCDGYDLNKSYQAVRTDESHYILKRFFTLEVCLGEIGDDAYAQLKIAENGQFGTHRDFSVTSGGETVYPPGAFVASMQDDTHGGGLFADASPNTKDYEGLLHSVTLADDFSVWIKDPDKTWYKIVCPDGGTSEGDMLTLTSFEGAPAGTCQVEVYVTTNGKYIEKLKTYEYSTDVYRFLVEIPELMP